MADEQFCVYRAVKTFRDKMEHNGAYLDQFLEQLKDHQTVTLCQLLIFARSYGIAVRIYDFIGEELLQYYRLASWITEYDLFP